MKKEKIKKATIITMENKSERLFWITLAIVSGCLIIYNVAKLVFVF